MGSGSRRTSLQREPSYCIQKRASLAKGRRSDRFVQMSWGRMEHNWTGEAEREAMGCRVMSEGEGTGGVGGAKPGAPLSEGGLSSPISYRLHLATQHNRPVPGSSPSPLLSAPGALSWGVKGKTNTLWPPSALFQQLPQWGRSRLRKKRVGDGPAAHVLPPHRASPGWLSSGCCLSHW